MKRYFALILTLILLLASFNSCDTTEAKTEHEHSFSNATCKSPKSCECGAIEGEPLNVHHFTNGVCNVCSIPLINELKYSVVDPNTNKLKTGFTVKTQSGYITDDDIINIVAEFAIKNQNSLDSDGVKLTFTQESILSGSYEWEFRHLTYLAEVDQFESKVLRGTLKASEFSENTKLTYIDNPESTDNRFPDNEIPTYLQLTTTLLDRLINETLIPALNGNESNVTVADFGFVNYN